jgi:hypothetical protein
MFETQIFERSTEHFSPHCYLDSTQNIRQLPRFAIQHQLQDIYVSRQCLYWSKTVSIYTARTKLPTEAIYKTLSHPVKANTLSKLA